MSVLLTGASGGIGAELARLLVAEGARILLVARDAERLAALAESLPQRRAHQVRALAADVSDPAGRTTIRDIACIGGGVNVLINNAAVPCMGPFDGVSDAQVEQVLQTNLLAPLLLTRLLLPHLRTHAAARVLNIGSVVGAIGLPGSAVYGASKAGLHRFSQALRRELADTGVRVQFLGPRATRTGFNDANAEAFNRATGTHVDTPRRVAREALNLLRSGRAERFIGFPEALAVRLNALAPGLLDGAFVAHRSALASLAHGRIESTP
jgi:short-subunit dehydrogenase